MAKKLVLNGVELFMLPQKVLYVPSYQLIVLSDWHIGKLGHFRKAGLFVPPMRLEEEFARLEVLLHDLPVQQVIFLGDLFHSEWNYEWDEFQQFLQRFPAVKFILTRGNHDILPEALLEASVIHVKDYVLLDEGLVFSHEPIPHLEHYIFNIVGHIHPGCEVALRGRQYYKLPCFYLEEKILTLPAFGRWTGLYILPKRQHNRIFAVVGTEEVIELT